MPLSPHAGVLAKISRAYQDAREMAEHAGRHRDPGAYSVHMYWADQIGEILDALDESIACTVALEPGEVSTILSWAEELHAADSCASEGADMSVHDKIRQCPDRVEVNAPVQAALSRLDERAAWLRSGSHLADAFGGTEADGIERAVSEIRRAASGK